MHWDLVPSNFQTDAFSSKYIIALSIHSFDAAVLPFPQASGAAHNIVFTRWVIKTSTAH